MPRLNTRDEKCFTLLVQQHHNAVAVGVAIELARDDTTVLPEDGKQPLVVALSDGGGVPGEGQVSHRHVADDIHLQGHVIQVKKDSLGDARSRGRGLVPPSPGCG